MGNKNLNDFMTKIFFRSLIGNSRFHIRSVYNLLELITRMTYPMSLKEASYKFT